MKLITAISLKLGFFILAAAGIVSACSMNCGCCDPLKTPDTKTEACCIIPVPSDSFIPLLSVAGESVHEAQDACNSCNCSTSPVKESNAVSTGIITLKMHQTAASVSKNIFIADYKYSVQTNSASLYTLTATSRPLRI